MKQVIYYLIFLFAVTIVQIHIIGCAQVLAPTGGARDSIPPKLINANPPERTKNFTGKKITLNFDEYIQIDKLQENLNVSPTPKINPLIDYKLKTVTIKLKDTLIPNTTYAIDFGNAIKDLNEGNPFRKYTYVFSTGTFIDSLEYSGKVLLAESGKIDSTLQVYLYRNAPDSAVEKRRPDYISKLDSSGNYKFSNLPGGQYKVYALKDGDGSKTYNSKFETFAFKDSPVIINMHTLSDTLFAYVEEKEKPKSPGIAPKGKLVKDIKLKIINSSSNDNQDLLKPLLIIFNIPIKSFNKNSISLRDTSFNNSPIDSIKLDSTNKIITVHTHWDEDAHYLLLIPKDFATDTLGNMMAKSDTIKFKTKKKSEYGSLKLHFKNLEMDKNPVLQFLQNNEVIKSYPLISADWSMELITPNEYELRILYDKNKNGKWDPGNYRLRIQPEKVIGINKKISIRANFDSDVDIEL